MAVAPLTWQTVAAPDFRGTMVGLGISNEALNRAFTGLSDSLGKFDTYRKDAALADILSATTAIQNPADIRPALGGLGVGRLGPAQFAALDAALAGRIKQASDLESYRSATVLNPIAEKSAQAKLEDFQLRAPLERDQIVANTGLTRANTGLAGANAARVRQQTLFDAEAQPERLQALRLGNEAAALQNDQSIFRNQKDKTDYEDSRAVSTALSLAESSSYTSEDLTRNVEALRGKMPDHQFAQLVQRAQAKGAYGGSPLAPAGTGRGAQGGVAQAAPTTPAASMLPFVPGAENVTDKANEDTKYVSAIRAIVNQDNATTDLSTGATLLSNALRDTRSAEEVAKAFGDGKTGINQQVTQNALSEIIAMARKEGVTLSPAAAGVILSRNHNFENRIMPGWGRIAGEGNPLNLLTDGVINDIQAIKSGNVANTARASASIQASIQQLENLNAQAVQADRELLEAYQRKKSQPNIDLKPYQEKSVAVRNELQRAVTKFRNTNSKYFPEEMASKDTPAPGTSGIAAAVRRNTPAPTGPEPNPDFIYGSDPLASQRIAGAARKLTATVEDLRSRFSGYTIPDSEIIKAARWAGIPPDVLKQALDASVTK